MPTRVLESLVMTSTFSIQLSESAVSIVDKHGEAEREQLTVYIALERHDGGFSSPRPTLRREKASFRTAGTLDLESKERLRR